MDLSDAPVSFDTLAGDVSGLTRAILEAQRLQSDPAAKPLWDDYRPWRRVRFIAADLQRDPLEVWKAIKASRLSSRRLLDLQQGNGRNFCLCLHPLLLAGTHRIDRASGGGGAAALESEHGVLADAGVRRRFVIRTLMDEAAESSMIEGAATTRKNAVELLRSGRPPKTAGERMVVNNYSTMQQIKQWLGRPLTVDMLLELQSMLTEGTIPDSERGRLRLPGEDIKVWDDRHNLPIFTPPPAAEIPARLRLLCEYANATHDDADFLHPLVTASILHFMVGYEHPFADGNGRTARAVFYWHALRKGYDLFEFLSISEIIRKGFARYPQAYLDTEHDDGDLTYFILFKLDVIRQALEQLTHRLAREEQKVRTAEKFVRLSPNLNLRQRLLIEHALRHPNTAYTAQSHSRSNNIALMTARGDLDGLVKARLMSTTKKGNQIVYSASTGLAARIAKRGLI